MNLILTPVYRSYEIVREMVRAIDKYSGLPFLHILVDDDSGEDKTFPIGPSSRRRILMIKRDIPDEIHRNGLGQAFQLGYDWATQMYINEKPNEQFENVFLIEADVIVQEKWDEKMLKIKETLPRDWLTLDVQSIDFDGKLTIPTTNTPVMGYEGATLEVTKYPDFQVTLFNRKIFDAGIKLSNFPKRFDAMFGEVTATVLQGRHFRTKLVSAYHYGSQSRKYLKIKD